MKKDIIQKAKNFHGHLGPFLVLGLKMGTYAKEYIKPKDFKEMSAVVLINPLKTPESCAIDGIQFSSCCTTGKCNLIVKEKDSPGIECIFKGNNRMIKITVKDMALGVIKHKLSDHNHHYHDHSLDHHDTFDPLHQEDIIHHQHFHDHGSVEDVAYEIIGLDFDALFYYECKEIK